MWPFKKKEVTEEEVQAQEAELAAQALEEKRKIDQAFVKEHFPIGTEFVFLGVRFRVEGHQVTGFSANYVKADGKIGYQEFHATEARTYVEGPNPLEIHNGRNE